MTDKEKFKEYSNDEITVVWKPGLCIHSENCFKGLPTVFNPKSRPWISVNAEDSDTIIAQIEKCPSGALSYYKAGQEEGGEPEQVKTVIVDVKHQGPLLVSGEVLIKHKDGREESRKNVALCRCGHSVNKPFCDGSHKTISFDIE